MKITNHKILITGSSSGIGLEMAIRLKNLGNKVIIHGRNKNKLKAISGAHGFEFFTADLSKNDELAALISFIKQEKITVLINNAGIQYNYERAHEPSAARIDEEISVNLTSLIKLSTAFFSLANEAKEMALVNISTGLAISPKKSAPIYCATKAAVHNYTKALRYQLAGTSIRVFEVLPPLVDTPMTTGRGKGKLAPEKLVKEFIRGLKNNTLEMNIGKVKLLRLIHRFLPSIADNILKNN